ncbi:MAG: flavodoxin [Planctomycetes bacterium]|nr:flavodoxin [Planctomycetota bacterium]
MTDCLIVYYSHSGNTRTVAQTIQRLTDGDLLELEPVSPYPQSYDAVLHQAKHEIQAGYLPPLRPMRTDLAEGTRVFIGSPNWWSTIAPPVSAFLAEADLAGKTVLPFCTHGGGGGGRLERDITTRCPDATVAPILVVAGDGGSQLEKLVSTWLEKVQA